MRRLRPILATAFLAAAVRCAPAPAPAPAPPATIRTGEDLVRAMHDRYAGRWYHTLSFVQKTSRVVGDSVHVETRREWAVVPGSLRIEMGPAAAGDGMLFTRDSLFTFRGGRATQRTARRNPRMILGSDVYAQDVGRSLRVLREEGFATAPLREDTWQGRPVYVVGAAAGDGRTRQFWVDRDRLLFVRMVGPGRQDPARTMDVRFLDYEPHGGGWVATRVEMYADGRRSLWEEYTDVKVDEALPPSLFDPARWTAAAAGH